MGAASKVISELTGDAVLWLRSIANKMDRTPEDIAEELGDKLPNLNLEMPSAFGIYDDKDLFYTLQEAAEGYSDAAVLKDPDTFRRAAAQIPMDDPFIRDMVNQQVQKYRDDLASGIPIDVPYLAYDMPTPNTAQITAHDGRHRSRALSAVNEPRSLVRMIPAGSHDPQYSDRLLSSASPDTRLLTEKSEFQTGPEGQNIGTLGDLIKFLSVAGVAAPGALSMIGDGDAPQVP